MFQNLLDELKHALVSIYHERLKDVYIFGSFARGEQDSESDLDILVILDKITSYGAELERTGYIASELSLKYGVTISRTFLSEEDWLTGQSPLILNAHEEAILV